MIRGLGYRRDAPKRAGEAPDLLFGARPAGFSVRGYPGAASVRDLIVDVLDQGDLNTCVANAGMQAVRAAHVRAGIRAPALGSRLFSYYCARAYEHATAVDGGAQIRTLFEGLNRFGFAPEAVWPYEPEHINTMPSTRSFLAAFEQRSPFGPTSAPALYRRIQPGDLVAVKSAIAGGYPVIFGVDVSPDFVAERFDPDVPLDPPTEIGGAHAMLLTGYEGDVFDVLNSWGSDFGRGGWCRVSASYVARAADLWVVDHAPTFRGP